MEASTRYETLKMEVDGQTAILTINRPEALNALNAKVLAELEAAFQALENNPQLKGVILTGAGPKSFVAGADISQFVGLPYEAAVMLSANGQRLLQLVEDYPKPVIAAVNGFALGGGCELAMACHMRVAAENAKFGQPEVNLGVIAGFGGTQRLPRLVGKGKAFEILLTGDPISANEALQWGLVNYVVGTEDLIPKCLELLNKVYARGPLAVSLTISAVNAGYDSAKNGYEAEAVGFAKSIVSADGQEGAAAFLEKRAAQFHGR